MPRDEREEIADLTGMFRCPVGGTRHENCPWCGGKRWVDAATAMRFKRERRAADERRRKRWEIERAEQPPRSIWLPKDTENQFSWLIDEFGYVLEEPDISGSGIRLTYRSGATVITVILADLNRDAYFSVRLELDIGTYTLNEALEKMHLPPVNLNLNYDVRRAPVGERLRAASDGLRQVITERHRVVQDR